MVINRFYCYKIFVVLFVFQFDRSSLRTVFFHYKLDFDSKEEAKWSKYRAVVKMTVVVWLRRRSRAVVPWELEFGIVLVKKNKVRGNNNTGTKRRAPSLCFALLSDISFEDAVIKQAVINRRNLL